MWLVTYFLTKLTPFWMLPANSFFAFSKPALLMKSKHIINTQSLQTCTYWRRLGLKKQRTRRTKMENNYKPLILVQWAKWVNFLDSSTAKPYLGCKERKFSHLGRRAKLKFLGEPPCKTARWWSKKGETFKMCYACNNPKIP